MHSIIDIDVLDIEEVAKYIGQKFISENNPYKLRLDMMLNLVEENRILFDDINVIDNNYFKTIYLLDVRVLHKECNVYVSNDTLSKLGRLHMITLLLFIANIKIARYCSLSSYFEYVYNKLTLLELRKILKFVISHTQAVSLSEAISKYDNVDKFILVFDILNKNDLINTKLIHHCVVNNYVGIIDYIYRNANYKGYVPVWLAKSLQMYDILIKMSDEDMIDILNDIITENNYDLFRSIISKRNVTIDDLLIDEIDDVNNITADLARYVYYGDV